MPSSTTGLQTPIALGKNLHTLSGTILQLTQLPSSVHTQLKTLHFREPIFLRDTSPLSICSALKPLTNLRHLSASFVLNSSYDHGGILRAIVAGAPGLEELDFTCVAKPCYLLDIVGRAVKPLRNLRVLSLGLVVVSGEDPPLNGAVRIARANPKLENVRITRLAKKVRLPLRMPLSASECEVEVGEVGCGRSPMEQMGFGAVGCTEYVLERDRFGIPKAMNVREVVGVAGLRISLPGVMLRGGRWGGGSVKVESRRLYESAVHGHPVARMVKQCWEPADDSLFEPCSSSISEVLGCAMVTHGWWRWEHSTRVKKYVHDLRPVGHPERAVMGWRELLLRDESSAGEEARLMMFCVVLGVAILCIAIMQAS